MQYVIININKVLKMKNMGRVSKMEKNREKRRYEKIY